MSELVTSPAATPVTPPASSTPPGTTAGNGTPASEWRAPASAGKFAGMTAEQILGVSQTLLETVEQQQQRGNESPAAASTPASEFGDFGDDEYISGAQLKQVLKRVTAPTGDSLSLAASANERIIRREYAKDFEKYGREIDALIARVPANLRTVDNLEQCVRMVRSNHLEEIASERAQQIASELGATFRSTGAGTPPPPVSREHSLESEHIPAEWKARAAAAKITEETVREFCRANDMSEKAFYEQFKTPFNPIVAEISRKGGSNG